MDNNELLQAIGQMMDARFETEREHTAQMMEEKLAANNESLRYEMGQMMEEKLEVTKRELQESINGVDMKLDRHFQQIRNLLKEDYTPVAEAARETKEKVADYDEVKSTQADHAKAIQQHNERITSLEEKAI